MLPGQAPGNALGKPKKRHWAALKTVKMLADQRLSWAGFAYPLTLLFEIAKRMFMPLDQ